jgi:hypothetical protein
MAGTQYELRLRASIPRTLLDVIRARFGEVSADDTVLIAENLDQASVRALLTLLWDTGCEVLSFEQEVKP